MVRLNEHEKEVILKADDEYFRDGVITQKCPRCGNELYVEERDTSWTVKCKTENCIKAGFRGI